MFGNYEPCSYRSNAILIFNSMCFSIFGYISFLALIIWIPIYMLRCRHDLVYIHSSSINNIDECT